MTNTVIIGAGPYGLSVAAHLRQKGIPFRIFGRPMDSWTSHMPKGMLLKSDGFASNISDPTSDYTLGQFCAEKGISYRDAGIPVSRETFASYGLAFKDRKVPELEDKAVTAVEPDLDGFMVGLDTGETFRARQVILAIGVTHFGYVPEALASLPADFVSHSAEHSDVTRLRGRKVVILGAGSSALDLAGLMHEAGAIDRTKATEVPQQERQAASVVGSAASATLGSGARMEVILFRKLSQHILLPAGKPADRGRS